MYRIRFHGRGGQGIKTASRVLGSAFFLQGYQVQDAPVYGAERRGAPIFAYVRASQHPIQERGIIEIPDLVVVADDTLLPIPAAGVLLGLTDRSMLLIHSAESSQVWGARINVPCPLVILPTDLALHDLPGEVLVGTICAGAAAALAGVIPKETLEKAIELELASVGREILAKNLKRALQAYQEMEPHVGLLQEGEGIAAKNYSAPRWINLGFEDAQISAPDIFTGATSVQVRTGLWRTQRPVIEYDRCHSCSWLCSTLCPDGAIEVDEDGGPLIDYDYCKGCMVCVAVCPWHAIGAKPEQQSLVLNSVEER